MTTEHTEADELFVVGSPSDPAAEVAAGAMVETGQATTATGRKVPRTLSSLRHRNFAMFWTAATISNTGSSMQLVVVPFVIYGITGSTAWLGFTAAATFFPPVLIAPWSGAIADRYSRRQVLLITQTAQMIGAVALWLVWITGHGTITWIMALLLVSAIAGGINSASWQAFVPTLVPREDLLNAVRLNSIQFTLARSFGPALAGIVLARLGAGAAFLVNALTFVLVIAALVKIPNRPATAPSTDSVLREFADGVAYMRRHAALIQCTINSFVLSALAYAIVQLAPAIAEKQLHVGKTGYGFLVASYGIGSIICGVLLAGHADRFPRSSTTLVGMGLAIAGAVMLAVATHFVVGVIALFVIGFAQTTIVISHNTTIQIQVSDAFRGRVMAVYITAVQLGIPLGAIVLGTVADFTGTRIVALGCGLALLCHLGVIFTKFDRMKALDPDTLSGEDELPETGGPLPA
jgi:MFS family permease